MNNYQTSNTPHTQSNVEIKGVMASAILGAMAAVGGMPGKAVLPVNDVQPVTKNTSYVTMVNQSSYDYRVALFGGEYRRGIDQQLVDTVSSVYAALLSEQEHLGSEFEAVLNDNLWSLYES